MVVLFEPAHLTRDPDTKLVPLTVMVKALLPTTLDVGERLTIVGTGLPVTVKTAVLEVPPPGVGLKTVIFLIPTVVRFEAGIEAVS